MKAYKRVFLIVLDSFGIGAEPDAAEFGDGDVNTLRTIAASEVLVSKKIQSQDLSTDGPAVSAELRALAREWDAKADALEAAADGGGFIGYVSSGQGVRYEGEERRTWWD